jgi:ABC-type multidrug transport system ATPase subunit
MLPDDNNEVGKIGADCEEFISVRGLSKVYHGQKDVQALDNVELAIKTGEVIVVIGPNGAGKTTLINVIAGAVEPSSGSMRLLNGDETPRFKNVQR